MKNLFSAKNVKSHINKIDRELDCLQKLDDIQPVNYSAWAASIAVVQKANEAISFCADFLTRLNDGLRNHSHPLPLKEKLFVKLNVAPIVSKIDLSEAYLQMEVDKDSKELLTINTRHGLSFYRWPPGVKSAPAIFQQIKHTMTSNPEGVAV